MIIADNITKFYQVQGHRKMVFENLSLKLEPGARIGLMGPNGAGKSTLLRLLCGVEKPNSGTITRTSTLSWPIGLNSGFIGNLTARENIRFVCRLFNLSAKEKQEKVEFVESFVEIGPHFDMPVSTYSSGMKSRIAFAMSMAFDFDFYVVDETLSAGDPSFKKKCEVIFNEKIQGKGIIMVSHAVDVILKFCTQGIYLDRGQLTYFDNIDDIIQHYEGTNPEKLKRFKRKQRRQQREMAAAEAEAEMIG